jgi:hypothetical protein
LIAGFFLFSALTVLFRRIESKNFLAALELNDRNRIFLLFYMRLRVVTELQLSEVNHLHTLMTGVFCWGWRHSTMTTAGTVAIKSGKRPQLEPNGQYCVFLGKV